MRAVIMTLLFLTAGIAGLLAQSPSGTLSIYYIDTEGGQSTLFVGSSGESLLVDTGKEEVDKMLAGYVRVITGFEDYVVYKVGP